MKTETRNTRFTRALETHVFRKKLARHGISGVGNYAWVNGEALYMGDPIAGRANAEETKAVKEMAELTSEI